MKGETRTELMAIPIVAVVFVVLGIIFLIGSVAGAWAWVLIGAGALGLLAFLAVHYSRRNPHPALSSPAPEMLAPEPTDATYRVLVIADESCVEPGFANEIASHGAGRKVEALVIAPAIGSWLARWTGDESAHVDARKHLDDTVTSLARAGVTARGETGADDPLQAADDGLRGFAADEIVFVTKPGTSTDWAEKGVVEAAKTRYSVPVTHIALSA